MSRYHRDIVPVGAKICECKEPVVKRWGYHLVGYVGTELVCKCGGEILKDTELPDSTKARIDSFWNSPEDW